MGLILGGIWTTIVLARWDIFPISLMLLSPFFSVFGGGLPVTVAVIHSIIADVTTERYDIIFSSAPHPKKKRPNRLITL